MSEKLDEAIKNIEIFFWNNEEQESGKKLFKQFAKTHETLFKKATKKTQISSLLPHKDQINLALSFLEY